MEWLSDSVTKGIPNFAKGLPILLVDHDTMSLMYIASMLEQCSYKVTTTDRASVALSMVEEGKNHFKLVLANMNMPDMDNLSFLHALHKKDIPVILMSSERNIYMANKALAEGACLFIPKPVSLEDLKFVWQHVYWNDVVLVEGSQQANCKEKGNNPKESQGMKIKETTTLTRSSIKAKIIKEGSGPIRPPSRGIIIKDRPPAKVINTKEAGGLSSPVTRHGHMETDSNGNKKQTKREIHIIIDDEGKDSENTYIEGLTTTASNKQERSKKKRPISEKERKMQEKGIKINSEFINTERSAIIGKEKERKGNNNSSPEKRSRVVWNPELHLKFTAAVSELGDKKAQPKTIQEKMNVPSITVRQVASHLQKYKAEVQRIHENGKKSLPPTSKPSCFHSRTEFPPPLEKQNSLTCQLGQGNLNLGAAGNTWSTTPKFPTQLGANVGSFISYDQRTPHLFPGRMRSSGKPNVDQKHNPNAVHIEIHGMLQNLNQMRKTSCHDMNVHLKGKQPLGLQASSIRVSEMQSPSFDYAPSAVASAYTSAGMFQLTNVPPYVNQNQDFPLDLDSKNQNQITTGVIGTTEVLNSVPAAITSGNATNLQEFQTIFSVGSQNLDPGVTGTTEVLNSVPATIPSSNATNPQEFQPNFSIGSQNLDPAVNQAPAAGSLNQNQPFSEYDDILKILQEDVEEFNNFACGPNLDDVDQYQEWLQKNSYGKSADP